MSENINRQLVLAKRPDGLVKDDDFEMRESPIPAPDDSEFLIKVQYLSFDPTQRGWLNDVKGYMPPVQIGEVMRATGVGEVVKSNHPDFQVGDHVQGMFGWQDYIVTDGGGGMLGASKIPPGIPLTHMLHIYGITGLTAYFGMLDVGLPNAGDVVVVSGAAGATGSVAGQIAKIKGCKVIGIAGGEEKCRWLTEKANFDAAIDYKSQNVLEAVQQHCPDGIDIYFDNVGGQILDDLLLTIKQDARVVLCGGISSGYGTDLPPGPKNYMQLVINSARMEGFLVLKYLHRAEEAIQEMSSWVQAGKIHFEEDIQEGLENAPATLRRLFTGQNFGKQMLRL